MTRARDLSNLIGSGNYTSTTFTATAGQTVFTIAHTQGFIQVFMNGLLLDETTDYTSNGTAVTLTQAATAGDELEVVKYNTFSVGDAITQTDADTRYVVDTADAITVSGSNVGIGTSSPPSKLSIEGDGIAFRIDGTGNTSRGILFRNVGGSAEGFIQTDGSMHFLQEDAGKYIKFSTANTERMRIDSAGRVTMPYQPAFLCRPQPSYPITAGGDTIEGTWSSEYNVGNHFNLSGGVFTAPVAGVYAFSWSIFASGSLGTRSDAYISVNGVGMLRSEINSYTAHTTNRTQQIHGQLKLSANDTVTFGTYQVTACSIYTTTRPWSYATGVLIG